MSLPSPSYAGPRSRRLPIAAAKIIATVVTPRIAATATTNDPSASRIPSADTVLVSVGTGCAAAGCSVGTGRGAAGFLAGTAAGAPYEGEVAITVRSCATLGSVLRRAVL